MTSHSPHCRALVLAICIALWLLPSWLRAQTPLCKLTLTGHVLDVATGEALPYATISLVGKDAGAITSLEGQFSIQNLCPGRLHVVVTHIGCSPLDTVLYLTTADAGMEVELRLQHTPGLLDAVVVTGTTGKVGVGRSDTLQGGLLQMRSGASLADALESLPGARVQRTGASIAKPIIDGQQGNRVAVVQDGQIIEGQQWGSDHAPEAAVGQAGSIRLVTGGGVVEFGPAAMGGTVVLEPSPYLSLPGIGGKVVGNGATNGRAGAASASINGRTHALGDLRFQINGTLRRSGDARTPAYHLNNTGVFEAQGGARFRSSVGRYFLEGAANRLASSNGVLRDAHIGNVTDLQEAIARGNPAVDSGFSYDIDRPSQRVRHAMEALTLGRTFGSATTVRLVGGHQTNRRRELDLHRSSTNPDVADLQLRLVAYSGRAEASTNVGKTKVDAAAFVVTRQNTYIGHFLIPYYNQADIGAYAIARRTIKGFELSAGGRLQRQATSSYFNSNSEVSVSRRAWWLPQAAIGLGRRWPKGNANATLTYGVRGPQPNELYSRGVHHGTASFEEGDSSLRPEAQLNLIVDASRQVGKALKLRVRTGVQRYSGFLYLAALPEPVLTIRGAFPAFRYQQADALFLPLWAEANYAVAQNWLIQVQANGIVASNLTLGGTVPYMPPAQSSLGVSYALERKGLKLNAGPVARYTSKAKLPPEGDFAPAPDAYLLVGAQLTAEWPKWGLLLALSANNLTNNRYRDYLNRLRYYADEPGANLALTLSKQWLPKRHPH